MRKLIILIGCLLAGPAWAGPDKTIQWLMDEPLSLLDYGIYKIEQGLQERFRGEDISSSAYYDWDSNEIRALLFVEVKYKDVSALKEECAIALDRMRVDAGNFDGELMSGEYSDWADYFQHNGFTRNNAPKQVLKEIDKKIMLKVVMTRHRSKTGISCQGPLLSTDVYFSE